MARLDDLSSYIAEVYDRMKRDGTITLSTEKIAYTDQFEALYLAVEDQFPDIDLTSPWSGRNEVWTRLRNIAKQGRQIVRLKEKTEDKVSLQQMRILKTLAIYPTGLTRQDIASRADVPLSMNATLGPLYKEDAKQYEEEIGKKTLVGRGFVIARRIPSDNSQRDIVLYFLTPLGERYLRTGGKAPNTPSPAKK